jgi:hypothetical protein
MTAKPFTIFATPIISTEDSTGGRGNYSPSRRKEKKREQKKINLEMK